MERATPMINGNGGRALRRRHVATVAKTTGHGFDTANRTLPPARRVMATQTTLKAFSATTTHTMGLLNAVDMAAKDGKGLPHIEAIVNWTAPVITNAAEIENTTCK